jgi:hypothetical protein
MISLIIIGCSKQGARGAASAEDVPLSQRKQTDGLA